jgi:N-acetylmuramoyl-L-alanine amidase
MKFWIYIFVAWLTLHNTAFGLSLVQVQGQDTVVSPLRDTLLEGQTYVSTDLFKTLFKTQPIIVPLKQKWAIFAPNQMAASPEDRGTLWTFTAENPFLRIHKSVYNLTYPVRKTPEGLYVPLSSILPHLNKEYSLVHLDSQTERLWIGSEPHNILNITPHVKDNGAQIAIQFTNPVRYSGLWVPPHYIVTVDQGVLANSLLEQGKQSYPKGVVRSIQSIQEEKSTQITFHLRGSIDTVEHRYNEQKQELVITVRKKKKAPRPTLKTPSKKVRTIIIDPGHGGKDPGAHHHSVSEKKITLAVAKRLKKKLERKGFKVLLTRDDDRYLTLAERPKFATDNGGDLFLSLHCNAIGGSKKKQQSVRGFVAYILRAGESEEDKALARRENAAVQQSTEKKDKKELSSVDWILLEHELNLYSHQSEKVAEEIVAAFDGGKIKKYSTGARQAGFFVLVGAFMPAVLFEMGFLTHDADRSYMNTSKGQEDISNRLTTAVVQYFKKAK